MRLWPQNIPRGMVFATLAFSSMIYLGINKSIEWALRLEAASTGMDWAHYLEARIPDLAGMRDENGALRAHAVPDAAGFASLFQDIFKVGNIYQIDFIHSHCFCEMSFGSFLQSGDSPVSDEVPLGTVPSGPEVPSSGRFAHMFQESGPHAPRALTEPDLAQYPIERDVVRTIAEGNLHSIFIHSNDDPSQPTTFAEVFHPVTIDGEAGYVLRVLVNLEASAARYATLLYAGSGLMLCLLVLAFGFPMRKYLVKSEQQEASDARSRFLAHHDTLTHALNRNGFQELMESLLADSGRLGEQCLIILFDLDNFKEVNDYYSHQVGDDLLCAFADALRARLPSGGHICRLGGDEFAAIIPGFHDTGMTIADALPFPRSVEVTIATGGRVVRTNISGGSALFPRDARDLGSLMQNADLALYAAKATPEGGICEYRPHMQEQFTARINLRAEFQTALSAGRIEPYYQPLISMRTGRVEGFEALARWNHPQRGILTPMVFEEMLHEPELAARLGASMLASSIKDMKRWKSEGVPFESVGLNIGDGDLLDPDFANNLIVNLHRNGLQTRDLAVEITENCMFGRNKPAFIDQLRTLRRAGCKIALDDFGTGFSSITQIKELPVTAVKIDKSFIHDVLEDRADQYIIRALVELGNSLGFKLVVEGVETRAQRDFLRDQGIDLAQGYYYARPMHASEVPAYVDRQNRTIRPPDASRLVG